MPALKARPADFLVRENLLVPLTEPSLASHQYLMLRKSGYTTFEAIRLIAERLACAPDQVTYAGLKDEDGITEQLVAVPLAYASAAGAAPMSITESDRWLRLQPYGFGTAGLDVGKLDGNSFRIVVRNLGADTAELLAGRSKLIFCALNYYDTQRFGVPAGPKLTHVLGGHILRRSWDDAFHLLRTIKAPESALAERWRGCAQEFFEKQLDPRVVSFYLSAYSSHNWNEQLGHLVSEVAGDEAYPCDVDGIRYLYLRSGQAAAAVLGKQPELPYQRLSLDPSAEVGHSPRATVVQTPIIVSELLPDELCAARFSVVLRFALPSGCYATTVVRQLLTPCTGTGTAE